MPMTSAERSARYRLKHGAMVRERAKLKQRERRALAKEAGTVKPASCLRSAVGSEFRLCAHWSRDDTESTSRASALEGQKFRDSRLRRGVPERLPGPRHKRGFDLHGPEKMLSRRSSRSLLSRLPGGSAAVQWIPVRGGESLNRWRRLANLHKQMFDIYSASGLSGLQFLAWPRLTVKIGEWGNVSKFFLRIGLAACRAVL